MQNKEAGMINLDMNDASVVAILIHFEGKTNPYLNLINERKKYTDTSLKQGSATPDHDVRNVAMSDEEYMQNLWMGTTTVEAADKDGWIVSITPSGGWLPACIAGNTGVGMSQRIQSFVLDAELDPFNVIEPGKRPRVTLTPSLALKDGKPFLSFAVQGGVSKIKICCSSF